MSANRRGSQPGLSREDRILWNRVASTAVPLKDRHTVPGSPAPEETAPEAVRPAPRRKAAASPEAASSARPDPEWPPSARRPAAAPSFDALTRRRLARGRIPVEASVDLHGMTQDRAHQFLLSFLGEARRRGYRHVMVITGHGGGRGGEGVLRRAVPQWLSTAPFRPLVSGYGEAGRRHGGRGALYLRLARGNPVP